MICISGMEISVTRGDCAPFTITFEGEDVPADGEKVIFSVKRSPDDEEPVIMKELEIVEGGLTITIMNADTKDLPFGTYEWDIRLVNMYGENEPYTPIKPQKFRIVKVIGNV